MRRILAVAIVGVLAVGGLADYLHINVAGPEAPFVSFSGAMVFAPTPCCPNVVIFDLSAYDIQYWGSLGIGYGVKNNSLSVAGGIAFVGNALGPFFFCDFSNRYLSAEAHGIIGLSLCNVSCSNTWDFALFLSLHGPCPVTLELRDANICDTRFVFLDTNIGICGSASMFMVVGCEMLTENTRPYLGCKLDTPQLQVVGKLYLDPCLPCHYSSTGLGITVNWLF